MICRHCGRRIELDGVWIDPEATGDDSIWRETCDAHDTFMAEHEPETCDHCGDPQWPGTLSNGAADWNSQTGNHLTCEALAPDHGPETPGYAGIDTFGHPIYEEEVRP
jgi:hypothetical protein